ncbi:TerC family protein [Ruania suaedae]|uniref:TerC family protein n=1 Tax=Ruania suaedae TaxID=2897774 RepID=UPI001E463E80|nr:TerC family protein [Ruania suaedae]UFU04427.1 TerC family protein [Ruania suaedae]
MDVPLWAWIATVGLIVVMLAVDFVGHVRKAHAPSLKEAGLWSAGYVLIALLFGVFVLLEWGSDYGLQYFSGYITEKSLSVDNLFVFVLIMASFRVPRKYQQKVLLIGIVIALVLRTLFIVAGAAIVNQFAWIFYIFGAFLIYTAITQLKKTDDDEEFKENAVLRLVRRIFPTTEGYVEDKMFTRAAGRMHVTPMFIVILAIGSADILFAVDSIPAIFGLTQEVFLIFAANAFSLLGLRQLYFLIDGLLDRLVYLNYGLAAILAFIGAKLVIHALHENDVWFINSGEEWHVIPEVGTYVSLIVIVGILTITTVTSLLAGRRSHQVDPAALPPTQEDDDERRDSLGDLYR